MTQYVLTTGSLSYTQPAGMRLEGTIASYLTSAPAGSLEGTLSYTRARFLAFSGPSATSTGVYSRQDRTARADILITDQDFSHALVGSVDTEELLDTIDGPDPVKTAKFEIADPRVASRHPYTISDGAREVAISYSIGPPNHRETWLAFLGQMAAAPNDEPFRAHATFTATSVNAPLLDLPICYEFPSHTYTPRGDVLRDLAESLGLTLTGSFTGRPIIKPLKIGGISFLALCRLFCDLEGWFLRKKPDGSLEILTEAEIMSADPRFAFSETDGVSLLPISEEPPAQPVTKYTISGERVKAAAWSDPAWEANPVPRTDDGGGRYDAPLEIEHRVLGELTGPHSVIDTATKGGVVIQETVQLYGFRSGVLVLLRKVKTENTWNYFTDVNGYTRFSQQLGTRRTTTTTYGADNTQISMSDETLTWTDCILTGQVTATTTTKYDASNIVTGYDHQTLTETWSSDLTTQTEHITRTEHITADAADVSLTDDVWDTVELWGTIPAGWFHTKYAYLVSSISVPPTVIDPINLVESGTGVFPIPPMADSNAPQYQLETVIVPVQIAPSSYLRNEKTFTSPYIESLEECSRVAWRKARREWATHVTIPSRILPAEEIGWSVTLSNRSRNYDAAPGFVVKINRSLPVTGEQAGAGSSLSRVRFIPDWMPRP